MRRVFYWGEATRNSKVKGAAFGNLRLEKESCRKQKISKALACPSVARSDNGDAEAGCFGSGFN